MFYAFLGAVLFCQVHGGAAAAFLQTLQQPNGGFVTDSLADNESGKPTLRATRTAVRAFRMLGKEAPHRERIIEFLQGCYVPSSGGFAAAPGGIADAISTSVGLMILRELHLSTDPYLQPALQYMDQNTQGFEQVRMVASGLEELQTTLPNASKWLNELLSERRLDGSFGEGLGQARQTGLYGVAIQRLGGTVEREATLKVLNAGQRSDGGFGNDQRQESDLESCYRIVRLYHRLQALPPDELGLRGLIANCKNVDGGYGRKPGERSSLHGTYYAVILNLWLDELSQANIESSRRHWDFDATPIGQLPTHWLVANTRSEPTEEWQCVPSDRGHCMEQRSTRGSYRQYHLCLTDYRSVNADIRVQVRAISGTLDQGGGLVWRFQDPLNYYVARWNPLENNFRVYKVVEGIRSQMDSANVPDWQGWQTLRIVTYGRNIRGYLNGMPLLEVEDDQFSQPGTIGLWTKSDAVSQFDDLQVVTAFAKDIEP